MREMNDLINLTVKLSKKIITVFCICLAISLLMLFDLYLLSNDNSKIQAGQLVERLEYLNKLGYSIDESSEKMNEIYVPSSFNEGFESFNNDLKAQGFDLEKIKGETIKRYTYKAENGKSISLFVYNNILVGHDIKED